MDGHNFDRLVRALGKGQSRRSVIKGLVASWVGGVAAVQTIASTGAQDDCIGLYSTCNVNSTELTCCEGTTCFWPDDEGFGYCELDTAICSFEGESCAEISCCDYQLTCNDSSVCEYDDYEQCGGDDKYCGYYGKGGYRVCCDGYECVGDEYSGYCSLSCAAETEACGDLGGEVPTECCGDLICLNDTGSGGVCGTEPEPTATATATPEPTATATPEPTATATPEPTATSTPEPTATATPEPTATSTPEPTATATPEPTATATPEPTSSPTPGPTASPTPAPKPQEPVTRLPDTGAGSGPDAIWIAPIAAAAAAAVIGTKLLKGEKTETPDTTS